MFSICVQKAFRGELTDTESARSANGSARLIAQDMIQVDYFLSHVMNHVSQEM